MIRLLLLVLFLLSPAAFAGYAQLAPPPGITSVGNVTTISTNAAAANGARYVGGHVVANASLNLGARTVTVPVAYRVAANAATFGVTKLNPWIAGASLVAAAIPLVSDWLSRGRDSGAVTDIHIDPVTGLPVRKSTYGFPSSYGNVDVADLDVDQTLVDTGSTVRSTVNVHVNQQYGNSYCGREPFLIVTTGTGYCGPGGQHMRFTYCVAGGPTGTSPAWCLGSGGPVRGTGTGAPPSPVTEADIAGLASVPIDPALLPLIGDSIPVDPVPVINPSNLPSTSPLVGPLTNPAPQAQPSSIRFPDGDPVPIPNTSPQRYTQPWQEVVPSPTPSEPWRVDIRPITTETTDPTPQPDPTPYPNPNPNPNPSPVGDFYTDCEKFPGSLGCMPVGTPPPSETIPSRTVEISQQIGPTFSGGGCPANLVFSLKGQSVTGINMATPCAWITSYVKPIILLLAAISAVFIVLPRSES